MIYFVRSGNSPWIKVGYVKSNVSSRLVSLQVGNPETISLLAVTEGTQQEEAALHHALRFTPRRGEWFEEGAALKLAVRLARGGDGAGKIVEILEAFRATIDELKSCARVKSAIKRISSTSPNAHAVVLKRREMKVADRRLSAAMDRLSEIVGNQVRYVPPHRRRADVPDAVLAGTPNAFGARR